MSNWIDKHVDFANEHIGETFTKDTAVAGFKAKYGESNGLKYEGNVGFNWYCGGSADNARRPVLAVAVGRGSYRILPAEERQAAQGSKTRTSVAPVTPADPFADNTEILALRKQLADKANADKIKAEIDRLTALLTEPSSN